METTANTKHMLVFTPICALYFSVSVDRAPPLTVHHTICVPHQSYMLSYMAQVQFWVNPSLKCSVLNCRKSFSLTQTVPTKIPPPHQLFLLGVIFFWVRRPDVLRAVRDFLKGGEGMRRGT